MFAEPWCCWLADVCTHLGKQGEILRGVLNPNKPLWLTAAWQSHLQMKLNQTHLTCLPCDILPSILNPASYPSSASFCLDRRCTVAQFILSLVTVSLYKGINYLEQKATMSPNMALCQHHFMYELEGVSGFSFKTKSRRHRRCCLGPSWAAHDKWKAVLCPNPFVP